MNKLQRWLWLPVAGLAAAFAWKTLPAPSLPLYRSPISPAAHSLANAQLLPSITSSVHSASIISLPKGDRLMFWFGGSREGAGDVAIWQSRFHDGQWSAPRAIMRPEIASMDAWRYIKKVGNPLAVRLNDGSIQLFFVSVSLGGWAGSRLNTVHSSDGGVNWSTSQKLITSPFINISTLARTQVVPLADGGFYLPVYHEFLRKFPELLRFDSAGNFLSKTRMSAKHQLLQPAMAQLVDGRLISLLRDGAGRFIHLQESRDSGLSWTAPEALSLLNRDASIALARLADGRLLLAYNDGQKMREQLALAVSKDGRHWQHKGWLEYRPGSGEEYSYPTILVDGDTVDVAYTWQRKQIKHVRFNLAWLDDPQRVNP